MNSQSYLRDGRDWIGLDWIYLRPLLRLEHLAVLINTLSLYFYVPARVYPNVLVFFNVKAPPKPTAVRVDENKKELEQNI